MVPGRRYLRQCVMEVFCSTSTDRSRKSSSLLLTYADTDRRRSAQVNALWCLRKQLLADINSGGGAIPKNV